MPYVDTGNSRGVPCAASFLQSDNAGMLNYALTRTVINYLRAKGLTYQSINDVVGALEGCKAEFQRRVVAPYEDDCIAKNGDVYPSGLTSGRPNA